MRVSSGRVLLGGLSCEEEGGVGLGGWRGGVGVESGALLFVDPCDG